MSPITGGSVSSFSQQCTGKNVARPWCFPTIRTVKYGNGGLISNVNWSGGGEYPPFFGCNVSRLNPGHRLPTTGSSGEDRNRLRRDSTIPEWTKRIFRQEKILREQLRNPNARMVDHSCQCGIMMKNNDGMILCLKWEPDCFQSLTSTPPMECN